VIFLCLNQSPVFGLGPHMCLGMHLARMETTVAINAVLDRLPEVRLDPAADDVHIRGLAFRAPNRLPVLFD
jgi:cytochrome P450